MPNMPNESRKQSKSDVSQEKKREMPGGILEGTKRTERMSNVWRKIPNRTRSRKHRRSRFGNNKEAKGLKGKQEKGK